MYYQLHLNNNTVFLIKRYLNIRYIIRICYIEFLNRHTIIHFVNNIEKKTTYPLKYWIEELSNKGFGQPYKSFLVNLDYVSGFSSDGKDIIMNNGEKIPLSKNFKKSFTNQYFANLHNIL